MHLLEELKRRNVIRVAIGYLAVSWLLQAGDARLEAHFAAQRAEVQRLRAALPAALAKENLAMLPDSGP